MRHSRLHRGLKADLPSSLSYGEVYFCTDTLQVYLGLANNSVVEVRDKQVLQEISNIKGDITSKNNGLISKINALTTTINNNKSDGDNKHNALAQTVADNKTAIDNKVNDLTGVVNANKSAIEHTVSELTGTVNANKTDANNKINALTGTVNANKSDADNKHNSLTQTVTDNRAYGERTYVKRADYLNGDIDFNNVTTPGMYYVIGGNHANKPPTLANGKGGMLIVSSYATNTKGIIQTFTDEVHGVTSTRVLPYGASTWGSWNTHYSVNSKPTPNDLGARPASWVPSWNDVTGKPSTFPPSSHNHDSAYLGKTATATNSDKLFGYGRYLGQSQGGSFGIPVVGQDGVIEIGHFIDFHLPNSSKDFDARMNLSDDAQSILFNNKQMLLKGQAVPSDIGALPNVNGASANAKSLNSLAWEVGTDPNKKITMGVGSSDVYIKNTHTQQYLQLRDDGKFAYNGNLVYHTGNKPTPSDIGALANSDVSSEYDANKVVRRNGDGDIKGRLFRANYQDDTYMNGALAFRTNSHDDNYTRYCNNPIAVNDWLGSSTGRGRLDVGVDLNTITKNGVYELNEISKSPNGIQGLYDWGVLVVLNSTARMAQIYYPHQTQNNKGIPYIRVRNADIWTPWRPFTQGLNWNDVQGKPSTFTPSSHTHPYLPYTHYTTVQDLNNLKTSGVYSIQVANNTNAPTTHNGIVIVNFDVGTPFQIWIPDSNNTFYRRTYNHSNNTWGGWSNTLSLNIQGNSSTATKLQTARSINGTNFDGTGNITTSYWGTARNIQIGNTTKSVNGSSNVSWSLSEIGASPSNHNHDGVYVKGSNIALSVSNEVLNSSALSTSRKQLISGSVDKVYVGNTSAKLILETSETPQVRMRDNYYPIYHTGNKPSWNDVQGKPSTFAPSSHDHPYLAWGNNLIDCRQPNDFAGLAKPNNVNIETWYGFSITNRCASDIPAGGVAFSVNARNGMVWTKGDIYARGDQRVYHTGFKPTPAEIGAVNLNQGIGNQLMNVVSGDLDNMNTTCFVYSNSSASGKPTGQDHALMQMVYNDKWKTQLAQDWRTNKIYIRAKKDGTWMSWAELYSTNSKPSPQDIGASPSNHNHDGSYLPLRGGTLTGGVSFNADNLGINFFDGAKIYKKSADGLTLHSHDDDQGIRIEDKSGNELMRVAKNKQLSFKGTNITLDDSNSVLWRGYHHMTKAETVTPSKKLSQCLRGWVLVWSDWDDGVPGGNNFNINYSYIPKNTMFNTGTNTNFALSCGEYANGFANKTLYIFDDKITGHDSNKDKANNPNSYDIVLRAVLEY